MAVQIYMSGTIGDDVNANWLRDAFHAARGQIVELIVSSPGGSVLTAVDMAKAIKDYPAPVICRVVYAASAASYLASVCSQVIVDDDSIWMMHHPWTGTVGTSKDLRTTAEIMDRLADILIRAYAIKSGKTEDEIRQLLDDETWLFGKEILDLGFADTYEGDESELTDGNRAEYVAIQQQMFNAQAILPTVEEIAAAWKGEETPGEDPVPNVLLDDEDREAMKIVNMSEDDYKRAKHFLNTRDVLR